MAEPETTVPETPTTAEGDLAQNLVDETKTKKRDVYNHVTVATGLRKREVREAVDATLAYLHGCLEDGKDLHLPPLGKVKVVVRGKGDNEKRIYKLVLHDPKPKADEGASAEAAE